MLAPSTKPRTTICVDLHVLCSWCYPRAWSSLDGHSGSLKGAVPAQHSTLAAGHTPRLLSREELGLYNLIHCLCLRLRFLQFHTSFPRCYLAMTKKKKDRKKKLIFIGFALRIEWEFSENFALRYTWGLCDTAMRFFSGDLMGSQRKTWGVFPCQHKFLWVGLDCLIFLYMPNARR